MANTQIMDNHDFIVTSEVNTAVEAWLGLDDTDFIITSIDDLLLFEAVVTDGERSIASIRKLIKRTMKHLRSRRKAISNLFSLDEPLVLKEGHSPVRRLVFSLYPELLRSYKYMYDSSLSIIDFFTLFESFFTNTDDLLTNTFELLAGLDNADDMVAAIRAQYDIVSIPWRNCHINNGRVLCVLFSMQYNSYYTVLKGVLEKPKARGYTFIKMPLGIDYSFSRQEVGTIDTFVDCLTDSEPPLKKKKRYLKDFLHDEKLYFCQPSQMSPVDQYMSAAGLGIKNAEQFRAEQEDAPLCIRINGQVNQHRVPINNNPGRENEEEPNVELNGKTQKPATSDVPEREPETSSRKQRQQNRASSNPSKKNEKDQPKETGMNNRKPDEHAKTKPLFAILAIILLTVMLSHLFKGNDNQDESTSAENPSLEQEADTTSHIDEEIPEPEDNPEQASQEVNHASPESEPSTVELSSDPYENLVGTWVGTLTGIESYGEYCYAGEETPLVLTIKDVSASGRMTIDIQAVFHCHTTPNNTVMSCDGDTMLVEHDVYLQYGEQMVYQFDVSEYGGINPSCRVTIFLDETDGLTLTATVNSFPSFVFSSANQIDFYTLHKQ